MSRIARAAAGIAWHARIAPTQMRMASPTQGRHMSALSTSRDREGAVFLRMSPDQTAPSRSRLVAGVQLDGMAGGGIFIRGNTAPLVLECLMAVVLF